MDLVLVTTVSELCSCIEHRKVVDEKTRIHLVISRISILFEPHNTHNKTCFGKAGKKNVFEV